MKLFLVSKFDLEYSDPYKPLKKLEIFINRVQAEEFFKDEVNAVKSRLMSSTGYESWEAYTDPSEEDVTYLNDFIDKDNLFVLDKQDGYFELQLIEKEI